MADLIQFLVDENPYGYLDAGVDLNTALTDVIAELVTLRAVPLPQAEQALANLRFVDGISARRKNSEPAPEAATYADFMKGLYWYFKGKQVRVSKAVRLEYTVGKTTHHILIGYEGSGGGM